MIWTESTPISTTNLNLLETRIDQANQAVTNAKTPIADSIVVMGQAATAVDSFTTLATKIRAISNDATAAVGNVLSGTTFYQGGAKRTGTMPNQAAIAPSGHANATNRTIGAYTAGNPNVRVYLMPPAGYYDGTVWVAQDENNLIASNVRLGTPIFGGNIVGTLEETKQVYISSPTYRSWQDPSNPYKVLKAARVDMTVTVRVSCQIICGLNNGVTTFMYITKNGAVVSTTYSTTASGEGLAISLDLAVNSGDLIECWVRPASFSGAGAIKNFLVTNVVTNPTKGAVIVD